MTKENEQFLSDFVREAEKRGIQLVLAAADDTDDTQGLHAFTHSPRTAGILMGVLIHKLSVFFTGKERGKLVVAMRDVIADLHKNEE